MSSRDSTLWAQARRARDKLVEQYINHPDVTLIDIGHAQGDGGAVVLRIHVKWRWLQARPEERTAFPKQVDDIPVHIISGEYRPEIDAPAAREE
jgi:hypothetical protein